VIDMARALGLTTPIPAYPSIFLGSAEVIPAEFVAAYAALDNGGWRVKPTLIDRVEDAHGKVLWRAARPTEQTIDSGVAFLTLNMMEDVVDHGTGAAVRRAGFWQPAAGKTGTTNDAKELWFVGITPDLAGGVWLGFDTPATVMSNGSGGRFASPIWTDVMKAAYENRPAPAAWSPPANIVALPVDVATGRLATSRCPPENVRIEYFVMGTEPHDYCPLHGQGVAGRALDRLVQGVRKVF
jgi:penicillin-binding protein 1A